MKTISIVIPLFNEQLVVEELVSRLKRALTSKKYNFEFVMVDDGSLDLTLEKLLEAQKNDPRIKIIRLSRNWGHQNAFNAGLDYIDGDAVIFMDGDLEDPPEIIPKLIEKWEEGFMIVSTSKKSRQRTNFEKILFNLFYSLLQRFSNVKVERQSGMFSLLDRKAYEQMRSCREKNKFYVGLRNFLGLKQTVILYDRQKRFAGKPKQTLGSLLNYALNALFSFSFIPIRILTYFGLFLIGIIAIISIFLIVGKLSSIPFWYFEAVRQLPGWISIILLILFVLAIQIIFLGVLGEYIARIFDEVRQRPYYVVEEVYVIDSKDKGK